MGNETSILKKCDVSLKANFTTKQWSLFDAKSENQSFSLFIFNNDYDYCNDFTRWKHVRHPHVVKLYEFGVYKNKKYILTEPVIPLKQILETYHHQFSLLSGLYNIGDALEFLHRICNISVNNLSIHSIFISKNDPNELWKIGSLYWCSTIQTEDDEFVKKLIEYHEKNDSLKTLSKENCDKSKPLTIKSAKNIHHRDVHSFVMLIQELLLNYDKQPKSVEMSSVTNKSINSDINFMVKSLIDNYHRSKNNEKPTLQAILNDQLFKNCTFVHLKRFLSNFSTYEDDEKLSFLQELVENLRQFPDQSLVISIFKMIVSSRFIMSNRIVYHHIMPYFLIPSINQQTTVTKDDHTSNESSLLSNIENRYLLTNGEIITLIPFIDEQTFRDGMIPQILELYCVHDYKIRLLLLKYLPHYGKYISKTCLKKILLPQILLGIKDSDQELVALTFRALASLIELFGVQTVLGGSNRHKYFTSNVSSTVFLNSEHSYGSHNRHTLINNDNGPERRNSISSTKSSILSDDNRKLDPVIFERSSPDGGETSSNENLSALSVKTIVDKFPSLNVADSNHQTMNVDHDEWPDWEESDKPQQQYINMQTAPKIESKISDKQINDKANKIRTKNEKFQTYDIKAIDFDRGNYTEEIDNLFMDMEPIVNFSNKNNDNGNSKKKVSTNVSKPVKNNDNHDHNDNDIVPVIDSSIFDDKNDDLQNFENNGWNDEDDGDDNYYDLDNLNENLDDNDDQTTKNNSNNQKLDVNEIRQSD